MDELIDKILTMPPLTLDESEWDLVIEILNNLSNKSAEAFIATLELWIKRNPDIRFDGTRLENFLKYLQHWNEVTSLLIVKIDELSAVWRNVFFAELAAEDLLPTLIELISSDESKLNSLLHKIDIAVKLDPIHVEACLLINIRAAATYKLQPKYKLENEKKYFAEIHRKIEIIREHLPSAAEELKRQVQLKQYSVVCNDYKKELAEKIRTKLIKENKLRFQPLFDSAVNLDHTILEIINNHHTLSRQPNDNSEKSEKITSRVLTLFKPSTSNEITDSDILLLFEKFKAIYDLFATCIERKMKTSESKLEEFTEKYLIYKDVLDADGDQIGMKILKAITLVTTIKQLITQLPDFIRKPTSEEVWAQTTGGLVNAPRTFINSTSR